MQRHSGGKYTPHWAFEKKKGMHRGLEPCYARRELEQQPGELPGGEPQQEQPREPQPEQRFSGGCGEYSLEPELMEAISLGVSKESPVHIPVMQATVSKNKMSWAVK